MLSLMSMIFTCKRAVVDALVLPTAIRVRLYIDTISLSKLPDTITTPVVLLMAKGSASSFINR